MPISLNLHFSEQDWERVSQNWCAWWAGELEYTSIVLECVEPKDNATPNYASTILSNHGLDETVDKMLDLFILRLQATHYLGEAYPRFWPNYRPGIVAAFAGSRLQATEDTT